MTRDYFCKEYFDFTQKDPNAAGYVFMLNSDTRKIGAENALYWFEAKGVPPTTLWYQDWTGDHYADCCINKFESPGWKNTGKECWPVYEKLGEDDYELVGVVMTGK